MARRNHKANHPRRISRAVARKPSRSHTRRGSTAKPPTHPPAAGQRLNKHIKRRRKTRKPTSVRKYRVRKADPRIEVAVLAMNRDRSLTAAARSIGFPSKSLQTQLRRLRLLKRKGKRWVFKDDRLRKVVITTRGGSRTVTVRGYHEASIASAYQLAARQFLSTNQLKFLQPFIGRSVQAANGRRYPLETDPNAVHRIAAMDSPPFHEIYRITSTT